MIMDAHPRWGKVIDRTDPEGLGRVKLRVIGITDESDWAWHIGEAFSGASGKGGPMPPPMGATVLVLFVGGNPEEPVFWTGPWSKRSPPPAGGAVTSDGDRVVWETERLTVEIDSRSGTAGLVLRDRATGAAAKVALDAATGQVLITSTLAVKIVAAGAVEINGLTTSINGRPVLPGGKPI